MRQELQFESNCKEKFALLILTLITRHNFQPVRPEFIMTAPNCLTANNPLYKDIQIDCGNIDVQLTGMTHNENYETTLLRNPPPTNHSSTATVNENRAEPYNMFTSSEVP